ncbi:MAG: hypothetical protein OXP37_01465 [Chloroflexota bacterium]|nr:hypothetical protein [Chloroflexota bacterium]MXY13754.1 hypothetical protein [Chloroflexota bacterium]
MNPNVLSRALAPSPVSVRTLDALPMASLTYQADPGQQLMLTSFDSQKLAAARALNVPTIRSGAFWERF